MASSDKAKSNQHVLKIHPAPLADLLSGAKTCEVRFNDRGFEVGDTVRLQEIDPTTEQFTGRPDLVRVITHIQQGYGLPDHLCVLSYAQPAAGEPEQQTAANAEDLPTKKYPLGAFDFDSPSSAPVAAGEPVYQHKNFSGEWAEIDKVYYEYQKRHDWPVRILWTAPPAAAHGDEAVLWELLDELRTATDRQALPGAFIRVMWEAGCDWINARAAMRAQGDGEVQ